MTGERSLRYPVSQSKPQYLREAFRRRKARRVTLIPPLASKGNCRLIGIVSVTPVGVHVKRGCGEVNRNFSIDSYRDLAARNGATRELACTFPEFPDFQRARSYGTTTGNVSC